MSCDKESTTLFLTTINATSNELLTSHTWTISMRTLLGTMYNKFDKFNLCLNSITSMVSSIDLGNSEQYNSLLGEFDRNTFIQISGLPLCNGFDSFTNRPTNSSILGFYCFNRDNITTQNYTNTNFTTFYKDNTDMVSITIDFIRIDGTVPESYDPFPHSAFFLK